MVDLRPAVAALLVVALASGCSDDTPDDRRTTAGPGGTAGSGGDVAYERVATDDLSVSPDGTEVLADCWNGICRWDAATGSLELLADRGSVAVAPDWSSLATVDDGRIVLEDLDSGEVVQELSGLPDDVPVTAVAYSADGSMLAAASLADGGADVRVWSVDDGSEQASFETASEVHTLAFDPDGERIASSGNGPVEVHDLSGGDGTVLDSGEGGTVVWSPDGAWLLGPDGAGQPTLWDTGTWEVADQLAVPDLHEAAFAPDSSEVVVTTVRATTVALWDLGEDEAVHLGAHTSEPGAVAWSPDGSTFYSVSADDGVRAWSADGDSLDVAFELPPGR